MTIQDLDQLAASSGAPISPASTVKEAGRMLGERTLAAPHSEWPARAAARPW